MSLKSNQRLDESLATDDLLVKSLKVEDKKRTKRNLVVSSLIVFAVVCAGFVFFLADQGQAEPKQNLGAEGWKLWQERRFADAEEKFEEAVSVDPKSVNSWNGLGWSRLNQGKTESALDAFEKCLELEPKMPAALNGMGQSFLGLGKLDDAKEYLTKAAPQAPAAWYGLARVTLLQEDYDEAVKWCRKIVNSQPQDTTAKQMLAAAKAKALDPELRKMLEPPKKEQLDAAKGWRLLNSGQAREAVTIFETILEENPKDMASLNGIGFGLLNLGEHEKAKGYFEKCIELSPKGQAFGPMNGLARCLKAEGKTDEAIKLWKEMDEKINGPNAGTAGLAETYLEQGKYEQAKKYYEILIKSHPDNQYYQERMEAVQAGLNK